MKWLWAGIAAIAGLAIGGQLNSDLWAVVLGFGLPALIAWKGPRKHRTSPFDR